MTTQRDDYFREITRAYLARRGAPFFLSPKDLALIGSWEAAGIPLAVVLEGIGNAFEPAPGRPGPRDKVLSLAFCQNQVRKAYERHRDRGVGDVRKPAARSAKRDRARAEVAGYLSAVPPGTPSPVIAVMRRAQALLAADVADEEALERLDDEIESALADAAGADEPEAGGARPPKAAPGAARARRIRSMREKYRVPYLSLFYY